jgi:hypothetical protein
MGRPLKIRKLNGTTPVDIGYPNNGTTNNGFSRLYPGVVGGTGENGSQVEIQARILVKANGTISTTSGSKNVVGVGTDFGTHGLVTNNSELVISDGNGGYTVLGIFDTSSDNTHLALKANASQVVTGSSFYFSTMTDQSSIIRQKGAKKYLVTSDIVMEDEAIAVGQTYMIKDLQDTNWAALGAPDNATAGIVFTAKISGHGLSTNGQVYPVGVCSLVDAAGPAGQNQMSISVLNNGTTTYVAKLSDHWVRDFDNVVSPEDGTNTKFVATFGTHSGSTDPATGYTIVAVENWC